MKIKNYCLFLLVTLTGLTANAKDVVVYTPSYPVPGIPGARNASALAFSGQVAEDTFNYLKQNPRNHYVEYGTPKRKQISGKHVGCEIVPGGTINCSLGLKENGTIAFFAALFDANSEYFDEGTSVSEADDQRRNSDIDVSVENGKLRVEFSGATAKKVFTVWNDPGNPKASPYITCVNDKNLSAKFQCVFYLDLAGVMSAN